MNTPQLADLDKLNNLFKFSINLNEINNDPLDENFVQDAAKWVGEKGGNILNNVRDIKDIGSLFIKILNDTTQIDIFNKLFEKNTLTQLVNDFKSILGNMKMGDVVVKMVDETIKKITTVSDKIKKMFLMIGISAVLYKLKNLKSSLSTITLGFFFGDDLIKNLTTKSATMASFFDWVTPIIGGFSILYTVLKPTLDYMQNFFKTFNLNKGAVAQVKEDDEITEESGSDSNSFGNPKAAGKVWNSGVKRKGNEISNHGVWKSGVTRGPANPYETMGEALDLELNEMKKMINLLNEDKKISFVEFADKRLAGATKIAESAKEKGDSALLTYHHFVVKLPYYQKAADGKFDVDKSKNELAKKLEKLCSVTKDVDIKQIEFQKLMGEVEVLGELIIKSKEY